MKKQLCFFQYKKRPDKSHGKTKKLFFFGYGKPHEEQQKIDALVGHKYTIEGWSAVGVWKFIYYAFLRKDYTLDDDIVL